MCRHLVTIVSSRAARATQIQNKDVEVTERTCVAHSGVVDLNADLVRLGRRDLDILDAQLLAGLPGDGGLASNRL